MSQDEEKELVISFLKSGAEIPFRKLYGCYGNYIYRLSLLLLNGDTNQAQDVSQEVWARTITKLHSFRWESTLKTWMTSIVINCCREVSRYVVTDYEVPEEIESLCRLPESISARIDLRTALALLPAGYREVLILHDYEGYKHEEIGGLLGISPGTSKSQLFHARKAIRKLISNTHE